MLASGDRTSNAAGFPPATRGRAPSRVSGLDPNRSPPDEFEAVGRELYLHCPKGIARTKLTNSYFDSKLATTSTIRNWATLLKLIELAD